MVDSVVQQTKMYKQVALNGVKLITMTGDSISYRFSLEINYSNYLYRKYAYQYLFTTSVSGSNLANYTGGDSGTWNPFSVVTRSAAGATNSFSVVNPDMLIIWAGYNDKNDNVPLGALSDTSPLTIAGAMRTAYANYQLRNPDMKVIFVTPNANPYAETNNAIGLKLSDYRLWIMAVAADMGVPCFDLWAVCGINDANKAIALPDQIHPTSAFLESWAPLFATFVLAQFQT